jgi:Type I phosphodiesterase / nucleotide pyrophosphatase
VPGYRWFERRRYRPGLPLGQWCARSYNGPEALLFNRDLAPRARTLFELTSDPVNVFGVITRGVGRRNNLYGHLKQVIWPYVHYRRRWDVADRWAARALVKSVSIPSELRFIAFPGIDWFSHYVVPGERGVVEAYGVLDRALGEAVEELRRAGAYDETLILLCSDHGHTPVHTHYDLPVRLEDDFGLRVAYHSRPMLRRSFDAVACVSGNGMAHVYIRGDGWGSPPPVRARIDRLHPGLREGLLAEPAVDVFVTRGEEPGSLWVESPRGLARLAPRSDGVLYQPQGSDPFGWGELPERITWEESLGLTFDSEHPDALAQIAQLFRSSRTGDLVVSAAPGYDLRERYEHPEHLSSHGALHREHMIVPVASSAPLAEGPMRTADIFPMVLQHLGREVPAGIDGVSRLAEAAAHA